MLKCGDYTLDRQIGWGRTATYYLAYAGDEAGEHRLVIRYSRYTDRPHVCAFLQAAAEQQTATTSGCRRVAPILDFGVAENGHAYTVNLNYEVSLAECIQAGSAIDHDRLRFLVTGILKALEELRDRFKRPHGNLTAGNILLDQKGEVILTDLAPPSQDHRYYPDLQALGLIIYQLVRQSVRVGFISPPLERSPEWNKSLGEDHADDWREFTNRMLLTQRGEGQEGLKRAVADLKALNTLAEKATEVPVAPHSTSSGPSSQFVAPTPRKRKKSRVGLVLVILILLGGLSAGAFFYFRKPAEEVVIENGPPPPPTPAQIAMKIPDSTAYPAGDSYLRRAKEGTPNYSQIASQLIYNWRVPAELANVSMKWNGPDRGWETLARELQTDAYDELASQGLEAKPEVLLNVAADIGRMAETLRDATALENTWTQILASPAISSPAKIAGLPTFKDWAAWRIQSSSDIKTAKASASAVASSLASFDRVARDNETNIHPDAWKKAIEGLKDFKEPKAAEQWPQLWANAIKTSLKPKDEDFKKWTADLAAAKLQIGRRPDPAERSKLDEELRALELRVQQTLASDDPDAVSKAIANFKGKIRHPLEDMDEQYRAIFAQFDKALANAATTADAGAAVTVFIKAADKLRSQKEFETTLAAFDANHPVVELIKTLGNDLQKPTVPSFGFGPGSKWNAIPNNPITETKGTFVWDNNGPSVTFHILKGLNIAIASIETSLELARLSGVPLDPPKDGPLAYRDTPGATSPWLWKKAEQWYQSAQRRWSERDIPNRVEPRTLFVAPNVDKCPVTWISAETARKIAAALGSRLPTRVQWAEALKKPSLRSVRLRGAAAARFDKEIDEYGLLNRGSVTPFSPVPQSIQFPGSAPSSPEVTPDNDGSVWLRAITDNPTGFSDLVGNASEWLVDDNGETFVVGGSFATLPRVNYTQPVPSGGAANFDITLRLAVPVMEGEKNAGLVAVRNTVRTESERLQKKGPIKMQAP